MRLNVQTLLLFSVFVVATCGLIYELVAGTLASYLLGDSVTQFSTIIGVYLFSMGIGSYLSKFFERNLLAWFIRIELLVALVGGFSSTILFLVFDQVEAFRLILYMLVGLTGTLVGLEIPLIMRILQDRVQFKDLVSQVFTFDYIGALLASVIFPLLLVPQLGLLRTSFFFGLLNALVGIWLCFYFGKEMRWSAYLKGVGFLVFAALLGGFIMSDKIQAFSESLAYRDKIVFSKSSPYQRVVLTQGVNDIRLFLNGNLQFSSSDEYRYHEALVHPGMTGLQNAKKVLVLGGGDGLAVREILKHPKVEEITLVDLDPEMTRIFSTHPALTALNQSALLSSKVKVVNDDAFQWLKTVSAEQFDYVVIDFPDPSNFSIGKLYSTTFYNMLLAVLTPHASVVIQATSPFVAPKSYWCIVHTLQATGFHTLPYHAHVPSFGDWGFVLASRQPLNISDRYPENVRFVNAPTFTQMQVFPKDMPELETEINKLNNQVLVQYFEEEWANFIQ